MTNKRFILIKEIAPYFFLGCCITFLLEMIRHVFLGNGKIDFFSVLWESFLWYLFFWILFFLWIIKSK